MSTWVNDDGLRVRFGADKAEPAKVGSARDNAGTIKTLEMVIDVAAGDFPAFGDADRFLGEPTAPLPANAIIRSSTLIVLEAFTSAGAPTLDLGLKEEDGTEIDHDGLHAAIPLASLATIGAEVAGAGALINTQLAANGFASINTNVADFTAGKALVLVEYILA